LHVQLQGSSDFAQFEIKNRALLLQEQPILWTNSAELKAINAMVFFKDSTIEKIDLTEQASILLELQKDSFYNQITATSLHAYFDTTGNLNLVEALGQAWTIFYPETNKQINDTTVQVQREGLNRLFADHLEIAIAGKEISSITYFDQPEGVFYPMNKIDPKEKKIKNFSWNPTLRPQKIDDLRTKN
ncbi:MAG: hypothetical protein ACKOBN_08070, partial [Flavobacteriales bacterium]